VEEVEEQADIHQVLQLEDQVEMEEVEQGLHIMELELQEQLILEEVEEQVGVEMVVNLVILEDQV
jgi:hypothetical protein